LLDLEVHKGSSYDPKSYIYKETTPEKNNLISVLELHLLQNLTFIITYL